MFFSNEPAFEINSIENALGTSLRYQVPKMFPLLSTWPILERVAGKMCIHFSQFAGKNGIMLENY